MCRFVLQLSQRSDGPTTELQNETRLATKMPVEGPSFNTKV